MSVDGPISGYAIDVDSVGPREWTEVLDKFDDAVLYQTWSYAAIRWGHDNLSHLLLKEHGEVVAAAQCAIKTVPGIKAGIAYVPSGPLWRLKNRASDPRVFRQMLRELEREYVSKRGLLLRAAPGEMDGTQSPVGTILTEEGFRLDPDLPKRRTIIMDLSPSLEDLRRGLKRQWRQNLQQAESREIKVVRGTSDEFYAAFERLYAQMRNRKDFETGVNVEEFGRIQRDLPEELKMVITIGESEGQTAAAYVASVMGDSAVGILAATNERALSSRAAYLVHWRLVEYLKGRGIRRFDLGGIDPDRNPGGYQYKSGLAGKWGTDVSFAGHYNKCKNPVSALVVGLGRRFRGLREIVKK